MLTTPTISLDADQQEKERIAALESYDILDTEAEPAFDQLTQLASYICGTPVALISLLDLRRQWFKSHHGISISETDRKIAFCAHAIKTPSEVMVVHDSWEDPRFRDNPLAQQEDPVRFYAGAPLVNEEGYTLGTLCVIDHKARCISEEQIQALRALAEQTVRLFEMRRKNKMLSLQQKALCDKNKELMKFAYAVSHDLKSPLNNISGLCALWTEAEKNEHPELLHIEQSAQVLRKMIDGILGHYSSDNLLKAQKEEIELKRFFQDIANLFSGQAKFAIAVAPEVAVIKTHKSALHQIFINLISNSIKYNTAEKVQANKLKGNWSVQTTGADQQSLTSQNVLGWVEGTDPTLKDEFVIYSAHYDHVGVGVPDESGDSIYNGTRDNGIGTMTVLEAAAFIAAKPMKRSAMFVLFTGEEKGLLGSEWFVDHAPLPMEQVVFCFNSDNAGYNDTSIATVVGLSRTTAGTSISQACADYGIEAIDDPEPKQNFFDRSDQVNFARAGVPALMFSLGMRSMDEEMRKYYHRPADNPDSVDYEYLHRFTKAYVKAAVMIGNAVERPFWVAGDKYYEAGEQLYGL